MRLRLTLWWHRTPVSSGRHAQPPQLATVPSAGASLVGAALVDPWAGGPRIAAAPVDEDPVAPVVEPEHLPEVAPAVVDEARVPAEQPYDTLPVAVDEPAYADLAPTQPVPVVSVRAGVALGFADGAHVALAEDDPRVSSFRAAAAALLDAPGV